MKRLSVVFVLLAVVACSTIPQKRPRNVECEEILGLELTDPIWIDVDDVDPLVLPEWFEGFKGHFSTCRHVVLNEDKRIVIGFRYDCNVRSWPSLWSVNNSHRKAKAKFEVSGFHYRYSIDGDPRDSDVKPRVGSTLMVEIIPYKKTVELAKQNNLFLADTHIFALHKITRYYSHYVRVTMLCDHGDTEAMTEFNQVLESLGFEFFR